MNKEGGGVSAWPVYLIEDDEAVMRACAQALKLADIGVRTFRSAEQALAALDEDPPQAIVCDVRLPGDCSGLAPACFPCSTALHEARCRKAGHHRPEISGSMPSRIPGSGRRATVTVFSSV